MYRRFKKDDPTALDVEIEVILTEMHDLGTDSPKYPKLVSYLERLKALKEKETRAPVSRDTLALIAGNLVGILLVVAYEQKHIITSTKGFSQIIRPK